MWFLLFHFKEFTFSIKNHYIESIKIVFSLSFMFSFWFLIYFLSFSISFRFFFLIFWFFFSLAKAGVSSSSRYSNVTWQDYYFFVFKYIFLNSFIKVVCVFQLLLLLWMLVYRVFMVLFVGLFRNLFSKTSCVS